MTHLCSDRVTHTKNRPCPWARSEQAISSTPKACKVFGSAGPSRQLPVCTGPAREQYTTQLSVVVGHFWRAKYGHFSRMPKRQNRSASVVRANSWIPSRTQRVPPFEMSPAELGPAFVVLQVGSKAVTAENPWKNGPQQVDQHLGTAAGIHREEDE